jgi:hypothetical protein
MRCVPWYSRLTNCLFLETPQLSIEKLRHTTLGRNDTAFAEGIVKKLEVRLLEESLGRTIGVGGVGNDDVERVLVLIEELEAVSNMNGALFVSQTLSHARKVLLRQTNDGL